MIPALVLGTGLFLNASSASAHPHPIYYPHHYPIVRPITVCPPVVIAPAPRFQVVYRASCNALWVIYNTYVAEKLGRSFASINQLVTDYGASSSFNAR